VEVLRTEIPDVLVLKPARRGDHRGFFSEVFNKQDLLDAGISCDFVQDNHSLSREKGVVRGLHFQTPPFAQTKLIRVAKGSIFDVAVDIRHGSPSFGKFVGIELSAQEWNQLYVPAGFAHGFCTLEPDTEVLYKVDNYYAPDHDRGLLWNDPSLAIPWPVSTAEAILSEKDRLHPPLGDMPAYFDYMASIALGR
jgi:dTDP-4-dehydrorhamnose 3,5-epimerase